MSDTTPQPLPSPPTEDQTQTPNPIPAHEQASEHEQEEQEQAHRLPVRTHHCRFCNHLLLATTRDIISLPRRKEPAKDQALILPLPREDGDDDEEEVKEQTGRTQTQTQAHYTILLSTTLPDRKPSLIRREDGFEKRLFLRCGRCRVVIGYFLDPTHFPDQAPRRSSVGDGDEEGEGEDDTARVVYLLPGALMETSIMGDEEKMQLMDGEWGEWISG